jgi:glycosyltransferase involved in cell wall biosynthesis
MQRVCFSSIKIAAMRQRIGNDCTPHICFVAPAAWPILNRDQNIRSVGGAEVQQCILARQLHKAGLRVSMVCLDYGQPDAIEVDGIRVFRAHAPQAGVPVVRYIHPRLTSIWSAMRRANAEIYYQRGSGALTGWVSGFSRRFRRRFVYAAAHDADFDPATPLVRYWRDKCIYRAGLRRADAIIVQNSTQEALCRDMLGIEPALIASCYDPPHTATANSAGYVLWAATMRTWKRPNLVLEAARRLPAIRFRIIGGVADDASYYATIAAQARALPNVEFLGFVPYAEIEPHFDNARLFLNTSEFEGFPNTFLQAWARGIPTISFVKPSTCLEAGPIPLAIRNLDEMIRTIDVLSRDDGLWREVGSRLRAYFLDQHSADASTAAYMSVIAALTRCEEPNEEPQSEPPCRL